MALHAPIALSTDHALERLHRPLVDVLRPALDRHFADWEHYPALCGQELATALQLYFIQTGKSFIQVECFRANCDRLLLELEHRMVGLSS